MATWEDGPEYAPIERPAEFTGPAVAPLDDPPPVSDISAGAPYEQPRFDQPNASLAPLSALVPARSDERDPNRPYQVVSATLTPDTAINSPDPTAPIGSHPAGAWGAAHWTPPSGAPAGGAPGPWGPTAGPYPPPGPNPSQPYAVTAQPPPTGGFPAPGTDQWFDPGPAAPAPAPAAVDAKAVVAAVTPGVLISLALGVIYVLAPITLCAAFILTSRISNQISGAKQQVQRVFLGAVALLALIALVAAITNLGTLGDWWSVVGRWALLLSVVVALVSVVLVRNRLIADRRSAGPSTTPWG